jgi:hypothetical protein
MNLNKTGKVASGGFTLAELIIGGAIIMVVAFTVYSVFASGINVWRKAYQARNKGHALRLVIEKFTTELRNTFSLTAIPLEGTADAVSFPVLIDNQIERASYFLDEDNNFCRRLQSYSQVFKNEESEKYEVLVSGLSGLKIEYCYLDNASGEYKWKDKWVKGEQDTLPQAVRIEFVFGSASAEEDSVKESKQSKTVLIPIGTGEQKIELIK